MLEWVEAEASMLAPVLLMACGILLVLGLVVLVLWLRARYVARRERSERVAAQRSAIDLELKLREQLARLRMVRELHEVAVHSVSVIIGQADGARYAGATDPTAAVRSAAVVADAARETLTELRRVMAIVREGEADASPQPRLRTARDLFRVMRDAGLEIVFEETGEPFDLPQGAELAVYRILQESLSNALKHGGEGTEVKVSFGWREGSFQLLVDDDGIRAQLRREGRDPNEVSKERGNAIEEDLAALTEDLSGPGITEMRERAALFGGTFNAYTVPGVGFSVAAVFPALRYDGGIRGAGLAG